MGDASSWHVLEVATEPIELLGVVRSLRKSFVLELFYDGVAEEIAASAHVGIMWVVKVAWVDLSDEACE
jgi:hypothetical protein